MLEVKNLIKIFDNGNEKSKILNNISLNIEDGEFIAVMGQSGSGKSTLLYNISGMDFMTDGEVIIDGINLSNKTDDELANLRLNMMGFVFQNNYLLNTLNLFDNICLPAFKANKIPKIEVKKRAEKLMKDLNIFEMRNHQINKVSGGQIQRAAICRALINNPKILFADEPTGALNSKNSEEVLKIINELNRNGMTTLIVTHDPKVASKADKIIYLKDGEIKENLMLGKFLDESEKVGREEKTLKWLIKLGF